MRYAPVLIQTPDNITVLCSKGSRTPSKHGAKLAVHVDSALPEAMGMVRHSVSSPHPASVRGVPWVHTEQHRENPRMLVCCVSPHTHQKWFVLLGGEEDAEHGQIPRDQEKRVTKQGRGLQAPQKLGIRQNQAWQLSCQPTAHQCQPTQPSEPCDTAHNSQDEGSHKCSEDISTHLHS